MKIVNNAFLLLLIFVFIFTFYNICAVPKNNVILVDVGKSSITVEKKILGNNFLGYDPTTYESWSKQYYGYSDYGAGLWDPEKKTFVNEVTALAIEAGISAVRFPGGCGAHHYDWKTAIGSKRKHFLYGIDEFLKTCEEIKAEPILTVSYFTGDEHDATDLVEYLNAPNDGSNLNGGIDWAKQRAKNVHPLPYGVNYFEIGNEVYDGDSRRIKNVSAEEYAARYLKYYYAMKAIDPKIKIGVVLYTDDWNRKLLRIVNDNLDFAIIHLYPTPARGERLERMKPENIFEISLGIPIFEYENIFQGSLRLLKKTSGKDVLIAVTEYNGGFAQEKPVPYRYCLGTALLNAELIRIFMEPQNRILMANYWNFVNEYWGMIANDFDGTRKTLYNNYYKRPNFYVFELYHKHFGDSLLLTKVDSGYYMVENNRIPYLSVNASIDKDKNKVYLMVINKNLQGSITASIELKDFKPSKTGHFWVLNGPSIDATNEVNHNNIRIKDGEFRIDRPIFKFTFEPHSLTAIEIAESKNEN
ncbi:MAG TPA: alpha-L-arabinofuranosidase C-terminal domain-containing protein [Candidatus Omnitrophota bacterium]|nr:alpha-L-arabinofuranosidase C-terminal domain-containing protein [Candidatus Omnitrophota bacterium]